MGTIFIKNINLELNLVLFRFGEILLVLTWYEPVFERNITNISITYYLQNFYNIKVNCNRSKSIYYIFLN